MRGRTYRYFNEPLFAFGYGMSYTQFEIGKAEVKQDGGGFVVTVPVSNKGQCSGTEIVQVYLRDLSDNDGPLKSLRGFKRVEVKPGTTVQAEIKLPRESFEFFDASTNTMRIKPGRYEMMYGNSSLDSCLKTEILLLD
jgi:beta-glucosidase